MRWKMDEPERGLARVVAGPRGHWLREGATRFAHVSAIGRSGTAWYWVAGWDSSVPHRNTCDTPVATAAEAKAAAMAYVREHLKAHGAAHG